MASLQRILLPVGGIGCFDEKLLGRRPVAGLIDKSDVEKNGPVALDGSFAGRSVVGLGATTEWPNPERRKPEAENESDEDRSSGRLAGCGGGREGSGMRMESAEGRGSAYGGEEGASVSGGRDEARSSYSTRAED